MQSDFRECLSVGVQRRETLLAQVIIVHANLFVEFQSQEAPRYGAPPAFTKQCRGGGQKPAAAAYFFLHAKRRSVRSGVRCL